MKYSTKQVRKNNFFVLYNSDEQVVCYFHNFEELSKYINYKLKDLVHEFNRNNTDIINIIIDNKKYELAIFS